MKKIEFNKEWICYKNNCKKNAFPVTVPHDAMLLDEKKEDSVTGVNLGWYDVQDYTYEKEFYISEKEKEKSIILEFEGVYHNVTIYLNDKKIGYQDYGYSGFYIDLKDYVKFDEKNIIRLEVINSDQPNSRWYSGTGIYRPVWMYLLPKKHIALDGIKITTIDYKSRTIKIEVELEEKHQEDIKIQIFEKEKLMLNVESNQIKITEKGYKCIVELEDATLWSVDNPTLYRCCITYGKDVREESFGIRMVECNQEFGFSMNGERVILRGACIHHDNGLLGACAFDFAERRKIKILKENGYNAIRSAHNPCSKALLKACDELGMLVMDEYVDVWYIHKTKNDYAGKVELNYKTDLKRLV
ncbi:MAG: glycoside hydrolase family 2 protein, partial [Lachnospiraceae bacterium]